MGEGGGVCCEDKGEGDGEREASEASDDPSLVPLDFLLRLCCRGRVFLGIPAGPCLETLMRGRTGLVTPAINAGAAPDRSQLCTPAMGGGFTHASLSFVFLRR